MAGYSARAASEAKAISEILLKIFPMLKLTIELKRNLTENQMMILMAKKDEADDEAGAPAEDESLVDSVRGR